MKTEQDKIILRGKVVSSAIPIYGENLDEVICKYIVIKFPSVKKIYNNFDFSIPLSFKVKRGMKARLEIW